jgi:hypothetical protein
MAYLNEKKAAPKRGGERTPFLTQVEGWGFIFEDRDGLQLRPRKVGVSRN